MPGKIFYRERHKVGKDEKKPRFNVVASSGVEIEFYSEHLRKKELEKIAAETGAELVFLNFEHEKKAGKEPGHGNCV